MAHSDLPKRIRDLLPGAARRAGMDDGAVEAARLFRRWRDIVGPQVADHAEPTSLRAGVLRVRTDSPAWATEIGYLAEEIRTRANEATGGEHVKEVRVWTGPRPTRPAQALVSGPAAGPSRVEEREPPGSVGEAFERARRAWLRGRSGARQNRRKPW